MNNLVVQLLLKTGAFSSDIKKAKGQINSFKDGCNTANRSIGAFTSSLGVNVGTLAKFGSAVGVATLAGQGLKEIINANQSSSDALSETIYTTKNALGELASAIGSFDFSNFSDGLEGLIRRGKEAAQAIDQLGNTLMSYNVVQAKAQLKISKARAIINNPTGYSKEDIEKAKKDMKDGFNEMKNASKVVINDYKNTIVRELKASGADISGDKTFNILDKYLTADVKADRNKIKNNAKKVYDEYQKELAQLGENFKKNVVFVKEVDKKNPEYLKQLDIINKKYAEGIAMHVMLEKYSDEELQNINKQRIAMIQVEGAMFDMENQMNKINNKSESVTNARRKDNILTEGSLAYLRQQLSVEQSKLNNIVAGTTEWKKQSKIVREITEKIQLQERFIKAINVANSLMSLDNIQQKKPVQNIPVKLNLNLNEDEDKDTIKKYMKMIAKLEEEINNMDISDKEGINKKKKQIDEYKKAIDDVLDTKTDKATDKWTAFNNVIRESANVMSNLSYAIKEGFDNGLAGILNMVSNALPAISSLITSINALTKAEATHAKVQGVSKAVSTAVTWIDAIAAIAALGAAISGALSSSNSAGKFAKGGIVGGSSFTGDRLTANVNSGEMILNKSQQGNLFRMINTGANMRNDVYFHISGNDLVGTLNNYNRKSNITR